jgi:hypothetical protein
LKRRGTEEAEEGIAKIAGLPPQQAKSRACGGPGIAKTCKIENLAEIIEELIREDPYIPIVQTTASSFPLCFKGFAVSFNTACGLERGDKINGLQ